MYKIGGNKFLLSGFLVFISGFFSVTFELLSLGSIVPLLNKLFDNTLSNVQFYNSFIESFNFPKEKIINFLVIFVFILFLFKNIFNIFYTYITLDFANNVYQNISKNFLLKKISLDYLKFSEISNSVFLRDVKDMSLSLRSYIELLLNYYIEILIFILLILFLLYISFQTTILGLIFILIFSVIYSFYNNKKIIKLGESRNNFTQKFNSTLLLIYSNFIEIKIFKKEFYFVKVFEDINKKFSDSLQSINFRIYITKYIIEFIVILLLLTFTLNFINEINLQNSIPLIGIYLVSSYRLLPSINRILSLRLSLKSHQHTINYFYNFIDSFSKKKRIAISDLNLHNKKNISNGIELRNIRFSFNKSKYFLDDINLKIKKNKILGIFGSSGSGKSTLVKIIIGLLKPESGKIFIDNKLIEHSLYVTNKISYISEKFYLLNDTIGNNICFGHKYNHNRIIKTLRDVNAINFLKDKKLTLDSVLAEEGYGFSSGQKQRLALARALYPNPEILILDEATNSLDIKTERSILEVFKKIKKNKIIIIISHRIETMKLCDHVIQIKKNSLV